MPTDRQTNSPTHRGKNTNCLTEVSAGTVIKLIFNFQSVGQIPFYSNWLRTKRHCYLGYVLVYCLHHVPFALCKCMPCTADRWYGNWWSTGTVGSTTATHCRWGAEAQSTKGADYVIIVLVLVANGSSSSSSSSSSISLHISVLPWWS